MAWPSRQFRGSYDQTWIMLKVSWNSQTASECHLWRPWDLDSQSEQHFTPLVRGYSWSFEWVHYPVRWVSNPEGNRSRYRKCKERSLNVEACILDECLCTIREKGPTLTDRCLSGAATSDGDIDWESLWTSSTVIGSPAMSASIQDKWRRWCILNGAQREHFDICTKQLYPVA